MITKSYNPSKLELEFTNAIKELSNEISERLSDNKVVDIKLHEDQDNPDLIFKLEDTDGDQHEVVVRLIQRADDLVKS